MFLSLSGYFACGPIALPIASRHVRRESQRWDARPRRTSDWQALPDLGHRVLAGGILCDRSWSLDTHFRLRFVAALVCALGVSCTDEREDLAPLLGAFRYTEGEISASCSGVRNSVPIIGIQLDIVQRSADEIEYTAGPRCSVNFRVRGAKATALPAQSCEMAASRLRLAAISLSRSSSLHRRGSLTLLPARRRRSSRNSLEPSRASASRSREHCAGSEPALRCQACVQRC